MKITGENFIKELKSELKSLGIDLCGMQVDHLCYRVKTEQEYFDKKNLLIECGILLTEALVNGRPIATFRLYEPFVVDNHIVSLIELPFPKQCTEYSTGFEHAEIVIKESFDFFEKRYPHLNFERSGHKNVNPELVLKTKIGQVKFHYQPLDRVIEIEKTKITNIVFDLDGTIINSREIIFEINQKVFSNILNRHVSIEEVKKNFHSEFNKLLDAFGVKTLQKRSDAIQLWGSISNEHTYEIFDEMKDLLIELKINGYHLHLWTARDELSAKKILSDHHLLNQFSTMSFANSENAKPHLSNMKSCIVIGDSIADIVGALNTKAIAAAAVWDKHACEHSLIASGAELCFYHISEFKLWLKNKRAIL